MKKSSREIDDERIAYLPTPEQIAAACLRIRADRGTKQDDDIEVSEASRWVESDDNWGDVDD
jgi:hypothetical protein